MLQSPPGVNTNDYPDRGNGRYQIGGRLFKKCFISRSAAARVISAIGVAYRLSPGLRSAKGTVGFVSRHYLRRTNLKQGSGCGIESDPSGRQDEIYSAAPCPEECNQDQMNERKWPEEIPEAVK